MGSIVLSEHQELKSHAFQWKMGQVLKHEELAEILDVPLRSQKYYNIMQKAIKSLTEIGILLSNVKGVGYKVLTADEWVNEAKRKIEKGGRCLYEAQKIVNHAPYLKMSEEARTECMQLQDLLIKHKYLLSGGVVQVTSLPKKSIQIREGNKL